MKTFFSEIAEQIAPTVVAITVQLLKHIFAQGATYVHELFTIYPVKDTDNGNFQTTGFKIEVHKDYDFIEKIDLRQKAFLDFKVDETPQVENTESVQIEKILAIRIENFVYVYKKK